MYVDETEDDGRYYYDGYYDAQKGEYNPPLEHGRESYSEGHEQGIKDIYGEEEN